MELLVFNILLSCILVTSASDGSPDSSVRFECPDSKGTSLVASLISECKVHYLCEDGIFSKLFECSESSETTGSIGFCQENPKCAWLGVIKQSEALPSIVDKSIDQPESTDRDTNDTPKDDTGEPTKKTPIEKSIHFFKCLFEMGNSDQFLKCVDNQLLNQPLTQIDSPEVLKFASDTNKNGSPRYEKFNSNEDVSTSNALNAIIKHVAPHCELLCKHRVKRSESLVQDTEVKAEYNVLLQDTITTTNGNLESLQNVEVTTRENIDPQYIEVATQSSMEYEQVSAATTYISKEDAKSDLKSNTSNFVTEVMVPIIHNIVNDADALANVTQMLRIFFEAAIPVATEYLEVANENFNLDRNAAVIINRATVETFLAKVNAEAYPIYRKFMEIKLKFMLQVLSRNVKITFKSWNDMNSLLEPNYWAIAFQGFDIYYKHYIISSNYSTPYITTYNATEMQNDIKILISLVPDVAKDALFHNVQILQEAAGITKESVSAFLFDIAGKNPDLMATAIDNFFFILVFFLFDI